MHVNHHDLVIYGGRVIDPETGLDGRYDIAVQGDRIAAVEPSPARFRANHIISAAGKLVTPGLIDIHAHVFEWTTGYGAPPDDVGINAGTTTCVDTGGPATWTFDSFKAYIIDRAETEVMAFPTLPVLGGAAGPGGPPTFNADFIDIDALCAVTERYPEHIRGYKTFVESGLWSHNEQTRFLECAVEIGERMKRPIYFHTGEVTRVDESKRPDPDVVLPEVLRYVRPGDIIGHCYSGMADGILGDRTEPLPELVAAVESGVLLDVGHGINFSFRVARHMIAAGMLPNTVSSDVHCNLAVAHDESTIDYSLVGAMSKLLALGVDLATVIAGTTINPARVLRKEPEIGSLKPGTRADITLLDQVHEPWTFHDSEGATLDTDYRLVPSLVVRNGHVHVPSCRLLRDLLPAAAIS